MNTSRWPWQKKSQMRAFVHFAQFKIRLMQRQMAWPYMLQHTMATWCYSLTWPIVSTRYLRAFSSCTRQSVKIWPIYFLQDKLFFFFTMVCLAVSPSGSCREGASGDSLFVPETWVQENKLLIFKSWNTCYFNPSWSNYCRTLHPFPNTSTHDVLDLPLRPLFLEWKSIS